MVKIGRVGGQWDLFPLVRQAIEALTATFVFIEATSCAGRKAGGMSSGWRMRVQGALAGLPKRTLLRCHRRSGIDVICDVLWSSDMPVLSVWAERTLDGDAFAEVVRSSIARAIGESFALDVPSLSRAVEVIREYQVHVGPLRLVVGWAESNWSHLTELLAAMEGLGDTLVVIDEGAFDTRSELLDCDIVDGSFLRLTQNEALIEVADLFPPATVRLAHERSVGNYLDFQSFLLHAPLHEGLLGTGLRREWASTLSPDQVIDGLIDRHMWVMAFDHSCQLAPGRIAGLVERAGDWFFNMGEHEYLYSRLSSLPTRYRDEPKTAYWRFAAACALGRQWLLMPSARRILLDSEAPELRAAVAMAHPGMNMLGETTAAISALEAPITLRAHGFALGMHGERDMPMVMFREAMRLADIEGAHHLVIASGIDIAQLELRAGNYREAIGWARWALEEMVRRKVEDPSRRLSATATLALATLLVGEACDAQRLLVGVDSGNELISVPGLEILISTLGDIDLVTGDFDRAEARYKALFERSPVEFSALTALELVALKLAQRKNDDAEKLAEHAFSISRTSSMHERAIGTLIKGMVLVSVEGNRAEEELQIALEELKPNAVAVHIAQASIWVAISRLLRNNAKGATQILRAHSVYLDPLSESGWKLLSANHECFQTLRKLYSEGKASIELRFLGGQTMRDGSRSIELSNRQAEILALLLLHPNGLTAEKLHSLQYGDVGDSKRTKVAISRLRKRFMISKSPYHMETPISADFVEAISLAESGEIQAALNLYFGPLLPNSDAPAIVGHRQHLEESLRLAVLNSQDSDALIQLGTVLDDDLEVWLAARASLPHGDYRQSAVTARIRRIRSTW